MLLGELSVSRSEPREKFLRGSLCKDTCEQQNSEKHPYILPSSPRPPPPAPPLQPAGLRGADLALLSCRSHQGVSSPCRGRCKTQGRVETGNSERIHLKEVGQVVLRKIKRSAELARG